MTSGCVPAYLVTMPGDEPLIRDAGRRWLVITIVWTGIALFFCAQDAVNMITRGQSVRLWVFRAELAYWWIWIPLTPIALTAARRYRISRANWPRTVAVHTLVALLVGVLHESILLASAKLLESSLSITPPGEQVTLGALRRMPVMVLTGFYKYWALVGVYYALDYARKYRERDLAAAELESRLAKAELQALRMQLQPHFLFNTLHAVSMLNFSNVDAANRMLVRLSDLLRMSLENSGKHTVPLRVELDFLGKYLEIEQTRYQDRLQVSFDVDPQLLDAEVPHLILQPLVENAIRHGIAQLARDGRIEVAATRQGDHLALRVCDNGPGPPSGWSPERSAGIGIANIRARLRQTYGSADLFTCRARAGRRMRGSQDPPMIRVVVVDDEPIARDGLVGLLSAEPDFELAGTAASGSEAVAVIQAQQPDIVFLDVQMPELDGFEVLEALALERLPIVVFVTAYDEFALRAFEVNALDYLLKPFDRERLQAALERVRHHWRHREADMLQQKLRALLDEAPQRRLPDRLVIPDAGRVIFLPLADIDWLEAAGNYVRIHSGRNSYLIRNTITRMSKRLPGDFLQVSRAAIVNLRRVQEVQSLFNGCFVFLLESGARVESSRRFRRAVAAAIKQDA